MIAAAGDSKRLGFDKACMSIYNKPAVLLSLEAFSRINPTQLFVTLSAKLIFQSKLCQRILNFNARILLNHYPQYGYAGSIKTVMENVSCDTDGILVTPVDSPIFCPHLLSLMISYARNYQSQPMIIVPYYKALAGHPVYLSKHFFHKLKEDSLHGLNALINANQLYRQAIAWPDARLLLNLNRPNDYLNPSLRMGDAASIEAPI